MDPSTYRTAHLLLLLVLAGSGLASWRIYFRYAKAHAPETSAIAMVRRLRREGNPDGTRLLVGNLVGIVAGITLLVLTTVHAM